MERKLINRIESEFETLVMDERKGIDCVPFSNPIAVNLQDESTYYHSIYVVYNPSMKHCKTLPAPPFREAPVIGIERSRNIVDIRKDVLHIGIYSSKTDSWRDAGEPFPFPSPVRLWQSGVYWKGSVHWIDQWSGTLHYFNSDCESMKTVAMPVQSYSGGDYSKHILYFGECKGHVHLMLMVKGDIPRFDIWEMRMEYSGWNVKYCVDLSPLTTVYPSILLERAQFFGRFALDILLIEEGEDSSRLILWIPENKMISFDLDNKNFKEMYDVNPGVRVQGFQYMEALSHV
ncbi:F-box protein At5g07610-like [Papaver somniferum]|uniref:F-box protein At5g07610-like n=1 Tax=Papaver somniferum TaxID=3469 RepID=UPI000E6F70E6|nr:F-box protein At5g07610-like [Papaver somniferum]